MSPQGDRTTTGGDDWWDKLYDDTAPDTAPTATGDTLDDRFHSASGTVTPPRPAHNPPPTPPPRRPAPWEPQPPTGPRTFPDTPAVEQPPAPADGPDAAAAPAPLPDPRSDAGVGGHAGRGPDTLPDDPRTAAPRPPGDVYVPHPRPPRSTPYVGDGPPTYEAEPTALPAARAHELGELVPDTVLEGARYGAFTMRAASVRGDSARFRGESRRDALLAARFGAREGALVMVAVATGTRAAEGSHLAAADACRWIGEAVGRSHARLAEDIGAGRREELKSGLHRLTDRAYGRLRARAAELGVDQDAYTADLRCLLLTTDPACRTRVFFGVGPGGLFRLRDGAWQNLEPPLPEPGAVTGGGVVGFGSPTPSPQGSGPDGERLTMRLGVTPHPSAPYIEEPLPPPAVPFRFRASVARPGDTLLLASVGLAEPLRCETALAKELADRWDPDGEPPGLAAFLADTQLRVKGYADDRTAVAVWEA